MRTILDNETGALIMIPDSEPDRRLIGHLVNCSDLREFSTYIECEQRIQQHDMTVDLGIPVKQIDQYTARHAERDDGVRLIGFNRSDSLRGRGGLRG